MPADGGRLHRTAVGGQAEHGNGLPVDLELGEAERRPAGHPVLRLHQPVDAPVASVERGRIGRRQEGAVAPLVLDEDVPVPPVAIGMGDQPVEAGPEHDRGDDGEDRDHRPGQVGAHGGLAATGRWLQGEPGAEGDHLGQAGRRGGPGDGRGCWRSGLEAGLGPTPGHGGQHARQGHTQDQGAAQQHRRVELGAPYGIEVPHRLQRGQR